MFKLKRIIIILFLLTSVTLVNAQTDKYDSRHSSKYDDWDDWDDFEFWEWEFDSRPMIEINYGTSLFEHKQFTGDFSENGLMEFKIGYSSLDRNNRSLVYLQENFLFVSKVSPSLKSDIDRSYNYKMEILRGGIGWRNGIGYYTGHLSIIKLELCGLKLKKMTFRLQQIITCHIKT